jgi:hypothetical protein
VREDGPGGRDRLARAALDLDARDAAGRQEEVAREHRPAVHHEEARHAHGHAPAAEELGRRVRIDADGALGLFLEVLLEPEDHHHGVPLHPVEDRGERHALVRAHGRGREREDREARGEGEEEPARAAARIDEGRRGHQSCFSGERSKESAR